MNYGLSSRPGNNDEDQKALEERIRMISQTQERIILSTFEIDADTSGRKKYCVGSFDYSTGPGLSCKNG